MKHSSILEAKVAARNRCNMLVVDYAKKAIEALTPFLGKKIVLISKGGYSDKVKAALAATMGELPCNGALHVWTHAESTYSGYSVKVRVNVSEQYHCEKMDRSGHVSAESVIYVAKVDDQGIMTEFYEHMNLDSYRTDYTAEEVREARAGIVAAQKVMDEAKSKLPHYFEDYDRY